MRLTADQVMVPHPVKAQVQKHWDALKRAGRPYWNGPVYSITRETKSADSLLMELGHTDFAHYLATRHEVLLLPYGCRIVAVGGVDAAHVDGHGYVRLDWCMDAELREEVGLGLDEAPVLAYKLRWLITEAAFGFRFPIYEIRLRLTAEELQSHCDAFTRSLRRQHHLPELQELVAIPRSGTAVDHFLATDGRPRAAYLEALLRTMLLP